MSGMLIFTTLLFFIGMVAAVGYYLWHSDQRNLHNVANMTGIAPHTPYLLVIFNTGKTQHIPMHVDRVITIGRNPGNTLQIDSHLVSRTHARIFYDGARWLVEDSKSVNGVFRKGRLIPDKADLVANDPDGIEIGPAQIRFIAPNTETITRLHNETGQPGPSQNTQTLSQQLYGRFVLIRALGEGGMSRVFLAQDTQNAQELVAIKILHDTDEFLMQKFRQESGLKLKHPHIMQVLELGELHDNLYLVLEYVRGVTLNKLMDSRHPMQLEMAQAIMGQLLSALHYAHEREVIHRDIKPGNVMLSVNQGIKVIDFSIAKVLSAATRTKDGLILGTPDYMSYEQACAQPVNNTSDLYSAAIVLYQLLTTHVPFSGDNPMDIVRQHIHSTPMPLRTLNNQIPPAIEAAILKALSKNPAQRFQSAAEFADALGCHFDQPLPSKLLARTETLAPSIQNERTNAVDIPTRLPGSYVQPQTMPHCFLEVGSGPRQGHRIALTTHQIIGRADIDPADGTISRQHFEIRQQSGGSRLRNISAHGTFVNAQHIRQDQQCNLQPGTVIHVGQTQLIYQEQ